MKLKNVTPIIQEDLSALVCKIMSTTAPHGSCRSDDEQKRIVISNFLKKKGIPIDLSLELEGEHHHNCGRPF